MKILFSPQRNDAKIEYIFNSEIISVTIGEIKDTFDFSTFADGKLQMYDDFGNCLIESVLPIIPIINAERVNGILSVTLLNFIGENATEQEKFPQWIEV